MQRAPKTARKPDPDACMWTVSDWAYLTSFSESYTYELLNTDRDIERVKIGGANRIITSPRDYIAKVKARNLAEKEAKPVDIRGIAVE